MKWIPKTFFHIFKAGIQKCGRALAPRNHKRGVRERCFLHFILHAYECCIAKLICVRY